MSCEQLKIVQKVIFDNIESKITNNVIKLEDLL